MYVVILCARDRNEKGDQDLIDNLLEALHEKYGTALTIISSACDRDLNKYLKDVCLANKTKFKFIEIVVRIYAALSQSRFAQVFITRNAMLHEIADQAHILVSRDRKSSVEDLIQRMEKSKRPVFVYEPGMQFNKASFEFALNNDTDFTAAAVEDEE